MKLHKKWTGLRYFAVSETGSHCQNYEHYEEKENCGHAHKTRAAARECLAKKQRYYCDHGRVTGTTCSQCTGFAGQHRTSAAWFNGTVHDQYGRRVTE